MRGMSDNEPKRIAGKARTDSMSASERKALATKAAQARWKKKQDIPNATHEGDWKIGKATISCHVLDDGRRVFSERGLSDGLSHVRSGSEYKRRKELVAQEKGSLPVFMSDIVAAYLSKEVQERLMQPVHFRTKGGGIPSRGIEAELLPDICEAFLEARANGSLTTASQQRKADAAEKIVRGLAKVGAIALIDEVTGYQFERDRDELQRLLEKYVTEEFRPWTRRFPSEYYRIIFELKDKKMDDFRRSPQWMGHITNNLIYDRLLPGMRETLTKLNPKDDRGNRKHRHHQHFTDTGSPHLDAQIQTIITLGKASIARNDSWQTFIRVVDSVTPKAEASEDDVLDEVD